MDSSAPIPLPKAQAIAEKIAAALTPYCTRLEIAGSIRRRRPFCGDIDLVAEPRHGQKQALLTRCTQHATLLQGQDINFIYRLKDGTQLDLFLATPPEQDMFERKPGNWGTLFLCRTGSKQHNIYIVETAKRNGMRWNPYHGLYRAKCLGPTHWIAGETEESIFTALGLDFIPPEKRER